LSPIPRPVNCPHPRLEVVCQAAAPRTPDLFLFPSYVGWNSGSQRLLKHSAHKSLCMLAVPNVFSFPWAATWTPSSPISAPHSSQNTLSINSFPPSIFPPNILPLFFRQGPPLRAEAHVDAKPEILNELYYLLAILDSRSTCLAFADFSCL